MIIFNLLHQFPETLTKNAPSFNDVYGTGMSIQTLKLSCSVYIFIPRNGLKSDPYWFLTGKSTKIVNKLNRRSEHIVQNSSVNDTKLKFNGGSAEAPHKVKMPITNNKTCRYVPFPFMGIITYIFLRRKL